MSDSSNLILNKRVKTLYKDVINQNNKSSIVVRRNRREPPTNRNLYLKSTSGYNMHSQTLRYNLARAKMLHEFKCNDTDSDNNRVKTINFNKSLLLAKCN
tara:strand:+ start:2751 stop:3050 length:300 start_codon:yes stop_codon:yes gene_type:complete